MKVFSQLEKAQLENTTSDTSSLPKGMVTYRTDLNVAKVSDGSTMKEIVDTSTTQTLAGKTLTAPVINVVSLTEQSSTPATPSAGTKKFYAKNDGKVYTVNSSGTELEVPQSAFVGDSGSGGAKGIVPAPASGDTAAGKFLKASGAWAVPVPTFTAPKITTYKTGGATGTHTFTGTPLYVRVRMVGGGGGGAGSSTTAADGGNGFAGSASTFGTTLLSAGGGARGNSSGGTGSGGAGGTSSLGSGPVGIAVSGGAGGPFSGGATSQRTVGGAGGSSALGGAAMGGISAAAGTNGVVNTGAGGSGAGAPIAGFAGAGGGSGGFVDAIISGSTLTGLSGSASYFVGEAGAGGSAGTSGFAGGSGGAGYIEVVEYYQ